MRYLLEKDKRLRGWKDLPFGLYYHGRRKADFFRREEYELLLFADGETDLEEESLTPKQRDALSYFTANGILREAQPGEKPDREQEYRKYDCSYYETCQWSVTGGCNFHCRHCFLRAGTTRLPELPFDRLTEVMDMLVECGIHSVSITGGEPLVRKDFWQIVDALSERDIRLNTLFTNGLLFNERFIEEAGKRDLIGAFQVQISFDGVGWHDWMRNTKGAEEAALRAFRLCRDNRIPASCSCTLSRNSVSAIRETVRTLAALNVSSVKIGGASPLGEWKNYPELCLDHAEGFQAALDYIPQYFEDRAPIALQFANGLFSYEPRRAPGQRATVGSASGCREESFRQHLACPHIRRTLYIGVDGNVLPCMSMSGAAIESRFPNVYEQRLCSILKDSAYINAANLRVSDIMAHNEKCASCRYREACLGGCRALAVGSDGTDYLAPDMQSCEMYLGGWAKKAVDTALCSMEKYDFPAENGLLELKKRLEDIGD